MFQLVSLIFTVMGLYNHYKTAKQFFQNCFPNKNKKVVLGTIYNKSTGRYETYYDIRKSFVLIARQRIRNFPATIKFYAYRLAYRLFSKRKQLSIS